MNFRVPELTLNARRAALFAPILALAFSFAPARANPQPVNQQKDLRWQDYELPGYQAAQKNTYQAAEFMLTTALERINAEPHASAEKILPLLERLITVCGKQGKYDAAEQYCKLAIQFSDKVPNNSGHTLLLKIGLAHTYNKEHKYSLSEIGYRQVLSQQTLSPYWRKRTLLGLAEVQTNEGKLVEAQKTFEQALENPGKGPNAFTPADRVRFAHCLYLQGKLSSSEEQLKDALVVDEHDLGPNQPPQAATLNNLAVVCMKTNRAPEAEQYMRRAVAIARQHRYADFADWQDNLNHILREQGKPVATANAKGQASTKKQVEQKPIATTSKVQAKEAL